MIDHHRTPAKQDKRLWLTVATVAGMFGARALHVDLGDKVLDAILILVGGYVTQSQIGQTLRTNKAPNAAPAQPAP